MLITVEKTEAEVLPYEFLLTDWTVFDAYPITGATVTATPSGLTIGTPVIDADEKVIQVKISGGTEGSVYKVTCKPDTDDGYKGEVAFNLLIANK